MTIEKIVVLDLDCLVAWSAEVRDEGDARGSAGGA